MSKKKATTSVKAKEVLPVVEEVKVEIEETTPVVTVEEKIEEPVREIVKEEIAPIAINENPVKRYRTVAIETDCGLITRIEEY